MATFYRQTCYLSLKSDEDTATLVVYTKKYSFFAAH